MSSPIQTIAIAGAAGNVGVDVVKAITSAGYQVVVITRQDSTSTPPSGPNVTVKTVDYSSKQSLVDALKGVQGVVSLLAGPGFGVQNALVDAAFEAGVTRFLPSEFGCDTAHEHVKDSPVFAPKIQTRAHLDSLAAKNPNFSYTALFTGPFLDFGLKYGLIADAKGHKANLIDGGDKPFSTTPIPEVAKAIVGVFKNLDATKNKVLRVQSARLTQLQVVALGEKLTGTKWEVKNTSSDDLLAAGRAELQKPSPDVNVFLMPFLISHIFDGKGASVFDKVDNDLVGLKSWSESDVEAEVKKYV